MSAVAVHHHIQRAAEFLESARLLNLDEGLLNASALLAVHAALSYSDALRVGLGEVRLASDDHRSAVNKLDSLLQKARVADRTGLIQLAELVSQKNAVSYGSRRVAARDLKTLTTRSERFARWANEVGKTMGIEGWRDDIR